MFAHHWLGGEWVDSEKRMESINPANGETIGTYTEAGEAEATLAIAAALKAFRETDWRKNRRLRAKVLNDTEEVQDRKNFPRVGKMSTTIPPGLTRCFDSLGDRVPLQSNTTSKVPLRDVGHGIE